MLHFLLATWLVSFVIALASAVLLSRSARRLK